MGGGGSGGWLVGWLAGRLVEWAAGLWVGRPVGRIAGRKALGCRLVALAGLAGLGGSVGGAGGCGGFRVGAVTDGVGQGGVKCGTVTTAVPNNHPHQPTWRSPKVAMTVGTCPHQPLPSTSMHETAVHSQPRQQSVPVQQSPQNKPIYLKTGEKRGNPFLLREKNKTI